MNKKTLILAGVLIVLVALAYLYQGPFKDWRAKVGKEKNFLARVDVKSIDKIEINAEGETTILEKVDDPSLNSGQVRWKVGGTKDFYAEQEITDGLINKLEEAAKANLELVSSNKDKKSEFRTDDSGVRVKLFQTGNMLADFIIGKMGNDFTSTYISAANTDKTYSLGVNLTVFNQTEWRDRTIFLSDKEKIIRIRFQFPGREFAIEKNPSASSEQATWMGISPYNYLLSNDKVDKVLDIMSNLTAVEIPEQNFVGTGLEKNSIIIQATGDGIDNTLMIGDNNKDGDYYAKIGNSDNIYLITKSQRDELNKKINNLK